MLIEKDFITKFFSLKSFLPSLKLILIENINRLLGKSLRLLSLKLAFHCFWNIFRIVSRIFASYSHELMSFLFVKEFFRYNFFFNNSLKNLFPKCSWWVKVRIALKELLGCWSGQIL